MINTQLQALVKQIQETKKSVKITKRYLVNALGCEKRTTRNVYYINSFLDKNNLETAPSYIDGWIDDEIELKLKDNIPSSNVALLAYIELMRSTKESITLTRQGLIKTLGCDNVTSKSSYYINTILNNYNLKTVPSHEEGWTNDNIELKFKHTISHDNFQLYSLEIDEYKNLKELKINFKNTNKYCCFIGLNGSGKSNLLEALSEIFYSLYHIATLKSGYKRYPCSFKYTIAYILQGEYFEIIDGKLKDGNIPTIEMLPKNIILSYSGEDSRLWNMYYKDIYEKYCTKLTSTPGFVPPFMFYINKKQWEISLLTLLYSQDIDAVNFVNSLIGDTACRISFSFKESNFKKWEGTDVDAFIEKLSMSKHYTIEEFRNLINDINFIDRDSTLFYFLYRCSTESDSQVITKINIEFDSRGNIDGLSEGEKKMIIANTMMHILSSNDSLCLFDEPDSHIHINRKYELLKLIDTTNRYNIVTSHSPTFVNIMNENNIRYLVNGKVNNTDKIKQISDLSGGQINIFDGALIISNDAPLVLVEGIGDICYIKQAIKLLSNDNEKYKSVNWNIIPMGGAGNAKYLIDNLTSCVDSSKKIIIVFDRDEAGAKALKEFGITGGRSNLKTYIRNNYIYLMLPITDGHTAKDFVIEDYFSKEHKKRIAIDKIECLTGYFNEFPRDIKENTKAQLKSDLNKHTKEEIAGFSILLDKIINIIEETEELEILG